VTDGEIFDSPDALCDDTSFWWALAGSLTGGLGTCFPSWDAGYFGGASPSWGVIIFDSEGRVTDLTRSGASDQPAVNDLANERSPCLAGQTIQYGCKVVD
jgi:hypothetical protein